MAQLCPQRSGGRIYRTGIQSNGFRFRRRAWLPIRAKQTIKQDGRSPQINIGGLASRRMMPAMNFVRIQNRI